MKKIELLSPAGDLERLEYAIRYGADAVYIGGKSFSLRSMASNFTLEDIARGCSFAHEHGAKIYVTCNIVMHESDLNGLAEYLKALEKAGADGIIASSPTILRIVKEVTRMEAHVSTQQSVTNSSGVRFFQEIGADRVVLARECTLEDIRTITRRSGIETEVFVEGAMCAGFSGRCMLSNVMTNRDANRGGCAQSCRWNYDVYQGNKKVSAGIFDFSMASKDLSAIEFVPALMDAGVSSLKIEGRMKSLHYIATVVNAYRRCIDEYNETGTISSMDSYKKDLAKGENRETSIGFFKGDVTVNEEIYNHGISDPSHEFTGIIESYNPETKTAVMEMRNVFYGNRDIEILSPGKAPFTVSIGNIQDMDGRIIESARHAQMKISFECPVPLHPFDLVR